MKVLRSWLLELCDLDRVPDIEEMSRALTRGGLEVEGMTDLGAGFRGVVVAEVVRKQPHPKSDKLTLVDVITERGGAATQVVCGAPNVPDPGRKVLWAQIGATLPGGMTLAAKPVKGIVSPGMLCAEDELGLGNDHAGIIVLAAVITHVIRWFFGDPDGPILLFYALFPSIFGLLAFMAMRWKGAFTLFAITCAVTAGTNQIATFIGQRGFDLAGGAFWGTVSIIIGFAGGLIWGVLGRYLGIGLEKAGVPTVEEPPALTGGRDQSYA